LPAVNDCTARGIVPTISASTSGSIGLPASSTVRT
jgi:hypothetical protein